MYTKKIERYIHKYIYNVWMQPLHQKVYGKGTTICNMISDELSHIDDIDRQIDSYIDIYRYRATIMINIQLFTQVDRHIYIEYRQRARNIYKYIDSQLYRIQIESQKYI